MTLEGIFTYVFLISLSIILYTYFGYGLLASFLGLVFSKKQINQSSELPSITVIIPAFNEKGILATKISNTREALEGINDSQIILITDGSTDGSNQVDWGEDVVYMHNDTRKGKSAAINRAMKQSSGEISVITDANAMVNKNGFNRILQRFHREKVGGVSGEKKVGSSGGSTGSEGIYWKYESWLKRASAKMHSLTGAPGELFAFRTKLFKPINEDSILDDMELSLTIIKQNYVIDYEPGAYAIEAPSKTIGIEFKRKIRIAAGVWQTIFRHLELLFPFPNFVFKFQFHSHRMSRWFVAPVCLGALLISNVFLWEQPIFKIFLICQVFFYFISLIGLIFRNEKAIPRAIFIPFYFMMMNMSMIFGFFRFLTGKETVLWSKEAR